MLVITGMPGVTGCVISSTREYDSENVVIPKDTFLCIRDLNRTLDTTTSTTTPVSMYINDLQVNPKCLLF